MRRVTADYEMEIAMKIEKMRNDNKLTLALEGRLDTTTAPQLEAEIRGGLDGVTELVLACGKLEYLSSAGLRVILAAQKIMNKQGKMIVRQVNETILEVFEITGIIYILYIE